MKKRNHAFAELDKSPSTNFSKSERRPARKSRQPLKRKAICRPCLVVCFPFPLRGRPDEVEVVTSGYSIKATKMEGLLSTFTNHEEWAGTSSPILTRLKARPSLQRIQDRRIDLGS